MPAKSSPPHSSGDPDNSSPVGSSKKIREQPPREVTTSRNARRVLRITGAERTALQQELRSKYELGLSIRDLALETGRSYGFVHKVLVESETALRSRGGAHTSVPIASEKVGKAPSSSRK